MDNSVIMIGIPSILMAGVVAFVLLRVIFKKTIVFTVGVMFLVCADFIAALAFYVGNAGIQHLSWGVPLAIIILFTTYYLMSKVLQVPLQMLTKEIDIISKGDLKLKLNESLANRNDELGQISLLI